MQSVFFDAVSERQVRKAGGDHAVSRGGCGDGGQARRGSHPGFFQEGQASYGQGAEIRTAIGRTPAS
jgi:hypothetical protein